MGHAVRCSCGAATSPLPFHLKSSIWRNRLPGMFSVGDKPGGILKNSTPKMPRFLNRQNRGIMLYVPRTVLEALGLHLFQDPSEKGGVLAQETHEVKSHNTVLKLTTSSALSHPVSLELGRDA